MERVPAPHAGSHPGYVGREKLPVGGLLVLTAAPDPRRTS
jgi:hypothetical protein